VAKTKRYVRKRIYFLLVFYNEMFIGLVQEEPSYGADVLRLWVSSVDYTGDVLIGSQILRQMSDMYRKLRGTMRFLLSNLHDWEVCPCIPFVD
jgi:isoleucyl-tRNA synthetase